MNIQFFSDLHLEFGAIDAAVTEAHVIVAAGDVDVGANGVRWLQRTGKPTIYIAGNHEYYGGEIGAVQSAIRAEAAGTNVIFLECETIVIDGVRFLGATLWTDFMGDDAELKAVLSERMNDYQQIWYGERLLQPADLVALNHATRSWLEQELARPFPGKTVVVTHHAPLYASWHSAANSIFRSAYCNNLSQLILHYPIDAWIHGHVHARSDYRANNLHVVCNPRGYDGYQLVDGFDSARILHV